MAEPLPLPGWRRIGFWRRAFQWGTTLLVLLVPFVHLRGKSLLRLDFPSLTLYAFGRGWSIEDLYLFLLLTLALILFFLLVTLALGRIWCGWTCPQTTLSDLSEWAGRRLGLTLRQGCLEGAWWRRALLQLFLLGLALLVAANLVWYFVSPYAFFPRLLAGELGYAVTLSLGLVAATVYLDLAFLRRLFCKEFCPYGRFQTAMVDAGTLSLRFHPAEAGRCLRCDACVRACPTGIDIRRGYQIECINCGRCLDACREVMARRQQPGIIRYTFGTADRGIKALLNPRFLLMLVALVGAVAVFGAAAAQRSEAVFKLERAASAGRDLPGGARASFFTAYLTNRTAEPATYTVRAADQDGAPLELHAAPVILLAPGERRRLDLVLVTPSSAPAGRVPMTFQVLAATGRLLAAQDAVIIIPAHSGAPLLQESSDEDKR